MPLPQSPSCNRVQKKRPPRLAWEDATDMPLPQSPSCNRVQKKRPPRLVWEDATDMPLPQSPSCNRVQKKRPPRLVWEDATDMPLPQSPSCNRVQKKRPPRLVWEDATDMPLPQSPSCNRVQKKRPPRLVWEDATDMPLPQSPSCNRVQKKRPPRLVWEDATDMPLPQSPSCNRVQKKRPPRLVWEDATDMPLPQSPSSNSCASSAVSVISERTKAVRAQYFFERRLLFVCTCLVGVAIIVWAVSISTDFWFVVDGGEGLWVNETKRYFVRSHSGLFKYCRMAIGNVTAGGKTTPRPPAAPTPDPSVEETATVLGNGTEHSPRMLFYRKCKWHDVFPSETKVKGDPMLDMAILNYTRTEIMFSIISLLVMIMGLFFSIYTFNNPRYTFKRLAGGIHFISCLSIFVVLEILMQSITYEREFLPVVHPPKASYHYSWSYYLAWSVFLLNLFAGCAFMWYSKKRKRDKAPNEEVAMADEPTIIGR